MTTSQITLPAPRTWAANDLVTVPRLRADAADTVALGTQRPMFTGQATTGQSWVAGSDFAVGLDTELNDPWNGHNPVTGGGSLSSQYFAPLPGWYLARAMIPFAYTSTTPKQFIAGLNWSIGGVQQGTVRGPLYFSGQGTDPAPVAVDLLKQTLSGAPGGSGDWMEATAFQGTGSAVNLATAAGLLPTVTFRWVCAISGTQPLPVPPLTSVPSPITSAWLNANVRDAARFLVYPPVCKAVYNAGSSTMASSTFPAGVAVPLNATLIDNYGGFSGGTYTFPVAGRYFCYGQFNLASAAVSTAYAAGLSVSGGTTSWGDVAYVNGTAAAGASVTRRLRVTAGQTLQLIGSQGSGSAIAYNTAAVNQTRLIIVWEGI